MAQKPTEGLKENIDKEIRNQYIEENNSNPNYTFDKFQKEINTRKFNNLNRLELLFKIEAYIIIYLYGYKVFNSDTLNRYLEESLKDIVKNAKDNSELGTKNLSDTKKDVNCSKEKEQYYKQQIDKIKEELDKFIQNLVNKVTEQKKDLTNVSDLLNLPSDLKLEQIYNYLTDKYNNNQKLLNDSRECLDTFIETNEDTDGYIKYSKDFSKIFTKFINETIDLLNSDLLNMKYLMSLKENPDFKNKELNDLKFTDEEYNAIKTNIKDLNRVLKECKSILEELNATLSSNSVDNIKVKLQSSLDKFDELNKLTNQIIFKFKSIFVSNAKIDPELNYQYARYIELLISKKLYNTVNLSNDTQTGGNLDNPQATALYSQTRLSDAEATALYSQTTPELSQQTDVSDVSDVSDESQVLNRPQVSNQPETRLSDAEAAALYTISISGNTKKQIIDIISKIIDNKQQYKIPENLYDIYPELKFLQKISEITNIRRESTETTNVPNASIHDINVAIKDQVNFLVSIIEREANKYSDKQKEKLLTVLEEIKNSISLTGGGLLTPNYPKVGWDKLRSAILDIEENKKNYPLKLRIIYYFLDKNEASYYAIENGLINNSGLKIPDFNPNIDDEQYTKLIYEAFILNALFSINTSKKIEEEGVETDENIVKICKMTPKQVLGIILYEFTKNKQEKKSLGKSLMSFFKTNCDGQPEKDFITDFTTILEEYSDKCTIDKREFTSGDANELKKPDDLIPLIEFKDSINNSTDSTLENLLSKTPNELLKDKIFKDTTYKLLVNSLKKPDGFSKYKTYWDSTVKLYIEALIYKRQLESALDESLKKVQEESKNLEQILKNAKENDPSANKKFLENINKQEGGEQPVDKTKYLDVGNIEGHNLEISSLGVIKPGDKDKLKDYLAALRKLEKWLHTSKYSITETTSVRKINDLIDLYFKTEFPDVEDKSASIKGLSSVFDEEFGDFGKDLIEKYKPNLYIKEKEKKKNIPAFKDVENKRKRVDRDIYELANAEKTIQSSLGSLSTILPSDPNQIKKVLKLARNTFYYNKLPYEIEYNPGNAAIDQETRVGGNGNTQFLEGFIDVLDNYSPIQQTGGGYTENKESANLNSLLKRIENLEKLLEKETMGGAEESKPTEPDKPEPPANKAVNAAQQKIEKVESIKKEIRAINESLSNIESTYTNVYESLIDDSKEDSSRLPTIIKAYQNTEASDKDKTKKYQDTIVEKVKVFESGKEWLKKTTDELRSIKDKTNTIYKDIIDLLKGLQKTSVTMKQIDEVKVLFEGSLKPEKQEEGTEKYYQSKGILFAIEKLKTNIINNFEKYSSLAKGIAESIIKQREVAEKEKIRQEELDRRYGRRVGGGIMTGGEDTLSIKQLFDFIEESFDKADPILTGISDINKRNADPAYAASVTEPSLFAQLYNKYVDQKSTEGNLIATYNFVEGLKASSLLPEQVLKINSTDKIIFVFVTLFIRTFVVTMVEYLIRKDFIKNITFTLLAYFVFYAIVFGAIILLINSDAYRMRIVFNYMNLNGNTSGVLTHITAFFGLSVITFFINTKLNPDLMKPPPGNLSDQEKISLMYKFEMISMIIWFFLLMIIILF